MSRHDFSHAVPPHEGNKLDFTNCVPPCQECELDKVLLDNLYYALKIYPKNFVINSAKRSKEWELSHNRPGTSSHIVGKAVDIRCRTSFERLKILEALIISGFNRIGIYPTFIHADVDETKPYCVWIGK